jgi:hypothetical protein
MNKQSVSVQTSIVYYVTVCLNTCQEPKGWNLPQYHPNPTVYYCRKKARDVTFHRAYDIIDQELVGEFFKAFSQKIQKMQPSVSA